MALYLCCQLTFFFSSTINQLVNASQGDNRKELEEAQRKLDEVQAAFKAAEEKAQEAKKREAEAKTAQQELEAALAELKAQVSSLKHSVLLVLFDRSSLLALIGRCLQQ